MQSNPPFWLLAFWFSAFSAARPPSPLLDCSLFPVPCSLDTSAARPIDHASWLPKFRALRATEEGARRGQFRLAPCLSAPVGRGSTPAIVPSVPPCLAPHLGVLAIGVLAFSPFIGRAATSRPGLFPVPFSPFPRPPDPQVPNFRSFPPPLFSHPAAKGRATCVFRPIFSIPDIVASASDRR